MDTSKVKTMNRMFYALMYYGSNVSYDIPLPNLATRTVTWQGRSYTAWDVSNVEDFGYMWSNACSKTTGLVNFTGSDGALGTWDTSAALDMQNMFGSFGYHASRVDLGAIRNWDTSSCENMDMMFYMFGSYKKTPAYDLSSWNVSNVITHTNFNYAATQITSPRWP